MKKEVYNSKDNIIFLEDNDALLRESNVCNTLGKTINQAFACAHVNSLRMFMRLKPRWPSR